jgi:hypothetical protein
MGTTGNQWDLVKKHLEPFGDKYEPVTVTNRAERFQPTPDFSQLFPRLTRVLSEASVTGLETIKGSRVLYSWVDKRGSTVGWLAYPPGLANTYPVSESLHIHHKKLLASFGGVDEAAYDDTALDSLEPPNFFVWAANFWLGERDCYDGLDWFDEYFDHIKESETQKPPVSSSDFVVFLQEGNRNVTAYKKDDSTVLMFAPDHAFGYVEQFGDNPDLALYTIKDCKYFQGWVEAVAAQWELLIGGC